MKTRFAVILVLLSCLFLTGCIDSSETGSSGSVSIGDIILNDGTVVKESEITDAQKSEAVAVVIGNTGRLIGVGLKQIEKDANSNTAAWCLSTANAADKIITVVQCTIEGESGNYTFTGDTDGSDNLEQIAAFLTSSGLEDDTTTLSNYPAFRFAKEYKDQADNLGRFEEGWYLPSIEELFMIYSNIEKIDKSLKTLNADSFSDQWRQWFMSSSQDPNSKDKILFLRMSDGFINSGTKTGTTNGYICAVREF